MATLIFNGGFEQGSHAGIATGSNQAKYFDRIVGVAGTQVNVETTAARSGTYGMRIAGAAANAHAGWQNSGNNGILGAAGTTVCSFWLRFPSLPAANWNVWIAIGTAGGQDGFIRFNQASSALEAVLGANTQLGPAVSANTWYHVDVRVVQDANPHTLDWRVDGVAQTSVSLAVASENIFIAGFGQDNATQNGSVHIDDVLLSLTSADYPLGKHKVVGLIPDTGGSTAEIGTANATARMVTNSAIDATHNSAQILTAVSEVPPLTGGSASGLGQRTSGSTNACGLPMTTYTLAAGETVTGTEVVVCTWAANGTAAANNLGVRAFNGTAETTLFAAAAYQGVNTGTPAYICKPYAGVTDQTTLNALTLRIGYSTDISPLPGIHAAYAEVAVKESTGGGSPVLRRDPHRGLYMR